MPLYEYQCDDCGHRFELIRKFSDAPVSACPTCAGRVRKLISSPAFQFKGTGWYVTDYARKPAPDDAPAESKKSSEDGKTGSKDKPAAAGESKQPAAAAGSGSKSAAPPAGQPSSSR